MGEEVASPLLIGVAGGSGSGKTTVVRRIRESLGPERVTVIQHDAYYRDLSHVPWERRVRENFDHPRSLETERLVEDLARLREGRPVEVPLYDFETHTRLSSGATVDPRPFVVVDGILVLAERILREMLDISAFVHVAEADRLARRVRRDMRERGRTRASVIQQFRESVQPMHERFVEPSRRHADYTIPIGGKNVAAVSAFVERIEALARQRTPR